VGVGESGSHIEVPSGEVGGGVDQRLGVVGALKVDVRWDDGGDAGGELLDGAHGSRAGGCGQRGSVVVQVHVVLTCGGEGEGERQVDECRRI
jgi:hypothetical protein